MTEITAPPRFRQGAGRLCLDYVRTLRYRGTPRAQEELADGAALAEWVRQCGPALDAPRAPVEPTGAVVREARALREAVYALVAAARTGDGAAAAPAVRGRLNRAAAQPVPVPRLTAEGELRWRADEPVTAVLALVARDALELAAAPALLARLHECAAADCGAVFLDASRPGTRRWCSMDVCGNRAKKSAYRARN
ncbi:CGNR zinc finger domain-containing protein [Streptomyces sp. NRRL F-5123]|uniref:CGNR zinc finger domain-containing protein n=1 Tax=Streptomyces sp. NRRL F-5123 TaxID=1463856 RepID=UPI0004E2293F|nr:ABATE domain-containing protein [Streptomyces sp. NRRL F-5123]